MKKYLAILLSVVLLLTSIISTSMFTASAEDSATETADTVVLPTFKDADGFEINLPYTTENVPDSVCNHKNVSVVKNTSKLPFQSLFSIYADRVDDVADVYFEAQPYDKSKGLIFYVEVPNNSEIKNNFDMGTPDDTSDDKEYTTSKYRFGLTLYGYYNEVDAETGAVTKIEGAAQDYQYGGNWYAMANGTSTWTEVSKSCYGAALDHGFKGYVYVPFGAYNDRDDLVAAQAEGKEAFIDHVMVRGLSNAEVFLADGRQYYGYTDATHPLVFSVPMVVTAVDADTSKPATDSVVIEGETYGYFTGKAIDYSALTYLDLPATDATLGSTVPNLEMSTTGRGTRTAVPTTSVLTDNQGTSKKGHITNPGSANAALTSTDTTDTSAGRASLETPVAISTIGGFLFHVKIPALVFSEAEIETYPNTANVKDVVQKVAMAFDGTTSAGAAVNRSLQMVGSNNTFYTLKDGTSSWVTNGSDAWYYVAADGSHVTDSYNMVVGDGTKEWSGYIYVPVNLINNWGTGISNLNSIRVGIDPRRHITAGATGYPRDGLAESFDVSAITLVKTFDSTTTVVKGDDGRLVDLATGELLVNDYADADEFIGNADIVNNGSATVLGLNNLPLKDVAYAGNAVSSKTATGGTLSASAKFVKSACAITSMPAINIKGDVTTGRAQVLQFDIPNVRAGDIDGFMFYVKTGDKPVSLGFNAATTITKEGGVTASYYSNAYDYYSGFPLLAKGADTWGSTNVQTPIPGVSQIPANFEGYMYLPKFASMKEVIEGLVDPDETIIWRLNFYMAAADDGNEETTDDMAIDFSFIPFTVAKDTWTKNYASMAFVNGSKVAQDIFTGEFTVPNDYNGDLAVNLLDLVRGKAKGADIADFRASYLDTYFK